MTTDSEFLEWKRELLEHNRETVHLLSNDGKRNRERAVCAAFLRCLGVPFSVSEIASVAQEPPDVTFRDARFEVCDALSPERRPHGEAKARLEDIDAATTEEDLLVAVTPPKPVDYSLVYARVNDALSRKASRYGSRGCAHLNALVYVRLAGVFLDTRSCPPSSAEVGKHGWRSVSFLMPPYGHVIYATESAPAFLRTLVTQTRREWQDGDTLFVF